MSIAPLTRGEVYEPLIALALGAIVFLAIALAKRNFRAATLFGGGVAVLGIALSQVLNLLTAGSDSAIIPLGSGSPILVRDIGPSDRDFSQVSKAELDARTNALAKTARSLFQDVSKESVQKTMVYHQPVLEELVSFKDGNSIVRYTGSAFGHAVMVSCDYTTQFSRDRVHHSCDYWLEQVFGSTETSPPQWMSVLNGPARD